MPHKGTAPAARLEPPYPWGAFLGDLDEKLEGPVQLRCLGGFVITQHYGIGRETSDIHCIDVLGAKPSDLETLAGEGSTLYKKYKLYLQHVTVVTPPCDYVSRLQRMFPEAPWKHLALGALDPTDLALSKLERNFERDREDFQSLVKAGLIDLPALETRYREELRPYLLNRHESHDLTLRFWLKLAKQIKPDAPSS